MRASTSLSKTTTPLSFAEQSRNTKADACEPTGRLLHLAEHTGLSDVRHVDEDVVGGVAVEWCAEALLVEVVADEADAATEDEQTVERANLDVLVRLLRRKAPLSRSRSTKQTAMQPSTFRMSVSFFDVVTFSTASA